MFLNRVTAGLLACAALHLPVLAQGQPFKNALPAKTLMFFSLPDIDTTLGEFQGTALAKMWREAEVKDFVKDAMELFEAKWKEGMEEAKKMHAAGKIPVAPQDILGLRVRSLTTALTGLSVQMGQFGPEPKIGLLVHVDFGASAATWRKLIEFGIAALQAEAGDQVEKKVAKLEGGVDLITLVPPQTEMSINIAFAGSGMVLGTLTDEVKAAVAAVQGQKTILPKDPDYLATFKQLGADGAELEAYVSLAGVVDTLMGLLKTAEKTVPNWPPQLKVDGLDRALTALGARSVRSLGISTRYAGDKSVTQGFALAPEAGRKGFVASPSKPVDLSFLRWVPKDVSAVSAGTLDVASIYDGLIGAVKAYNPDMADQLLGRLAGMEEQVGISLKDDLFGVFGDQMVQWSMGVSNLLSPPEMAVLLKIKDQERLLKTLGKVAELSRGAVEFPVRELNGIKTWRVELNPAMLPQELAGGLSVVQPSFAFKDNYMIIALSTGDVRRAYKRMDREDDPSTDIRSNKEFARYIADIEQKKPSSFSWTDWRATFESFYSAATGALAVFGNSDSVPFNMTLLPEAETLSKHLFSSMSWSTTIPDGFKSTSVGPFGPEVFAGGVVLGVAAGAAMFTAVRAR